MDKIVKLVADKAGISESQAQTAVTTVANVLKERMPEGMASQVDNYLKDEGGEGGVGGAASKIGGMF